MRHRNCVLLLVLSPMVLFGAGSLVPYPAVLREKREGGVFLCRTSRLSSKVTFLKDERIPPEGYRAEVSSNAMVVWSSDAAGAFYAVRTLEQWARKTYVPDPLKASIKEHAYDFELDAVEIEDIPL